LQIESFWSRQNCLEADRWRSASTIRYHCGWRMHPLGAAQTRLCWVCRAVQRQDGVV
jgi:hypothetical protein